MVHEQDKVDPFIPLIDVPSYVFMKPFEYWEHIVKIYNIIYDL